MFKSYIEKIHLKRVTTKPLFTVSLRVYMCAYARAYVCVYACMCAWVQMCFTIRDYWNFANRRLCFGWSHAFPGININATIFSILGLSEKCIEFDQIALSVSLYLDLSEDR